MFRLACTSFLLAALLLIGCGATFVGFAWDPYGTATFTGVVSVVHVTVINDGTGALITISAVTLVTEGTPTTLNLCGDQSDRFPISQTVRAKVSSGSPCSTLVAVVIL